MDGSAIPPHIFKVVSGRDLPLPRHCAELERVAHATPRLDGTRCRDVPLTRGRRAEGHPEEATHAVVDRAMNRAALDLEMRVHPSLPS
jgi:hypothetical protein